MRPIAELEERLNRRRWFENQNRTTLYRQALTLEVSSVVLAELGYEVLESQHHISPIFGKTGSSKSTLMRMLASMNRRLKYKLRDINAEFILTWSPVQSVAKAQLNKLPRWADMGQDEYRGGRVGKGAASSEEGFITLTETLRGEQNSFYTCSPRQPSTLECHFALRSLGYYEGEVKVKGRGSLFNVSRALLLGPEHNLPMAHVLLDEGLYHFETPSGQLVDKDFEGIKKKIYDKPGFWKVDPYIEETYDASKRGYMALVKKYGGTPPEYSPEVMEYVENRFMDHLETHHAEDLYELTKTELEDIYMREARLPALFYMENLIVKVSAKLRKERRKRIARHKTEKLKAEEERTQEQENLIDEIAPQMLAHFQRMTPNGKTPQRAELRDWLRSLDMIEERIFGRCIDRFLSLWAEAQRADEIIQEAKAKALAPPPIQPSDFDTSPEYWLKFVKKRFPDLVPARRYPNEKGVTWWEAYIKWIDKEAKFASQRKIGDTLGVSRRTVRDNFNSIEGAMKREMGYEFERTMLTIYTSSEFIRAGIIKIDPSEDEPSEKEKPDRVIYLRGGRILVLSWKCHHENESFKVKDSPEWKLTKELLTRNQNAIMRLEGLFKNRFFLKEIDTSSDLASVRIKESDFIQWPPPAEKLLERPARPGHSRLESKKPSPRGAGGEEAEGGRGV